MNEVHVERHTPPDALAQPAQEIPVYFPTEEAPQLAPPPPAMSLSRVHRDGPAVDDHLIKAREAQVHRANELKQARAQQAAHSQSGGGYTQQQEAPPYQAPCSEVEITLPDGQIIVMAPPVGICEILENKIMAQWSFADEKLLSYSKGLVRAMLYVRTLNGVTLSPPVNGVEFNQLAQKLGNDGIEIVKDIFNECFPQLQRGQLKIVKKY